MCKFKVGDVVERIIDYYNGLIKEKKYLVSDISGLGRYIKVEGDDRWHFANLFKLAETTLHDRIKALEEELANLKTSLEPKEGDICKFWDDDESKFMVGVFEVKNQCQIFPFETNGNNIFQNAQKITDPEILKYFGK